MKQRFELIAAVLGAIAIGLGVWDLAVQRDGSGRTAATSIFIGLLVVVLALNSYRKRSGRVS